MHNQKNTYESPAKQPIRNNVSIIGIILIISITAIIFCGCQSSVNSSPEELVRTAVIAIHKVDAEAYIRCFADYRLQYFANRFGLPEDAKTKEIANAMEDKWKNQIPKDIKIHSCEIIQQSKTEEFPVRVSIDGLTDEIYATVTEVAEVRICYTVDGEQETESTYYCFKISGKWYLI